MGRTRAKTKAATAEHTSPETPETEHTSAPADHSSPPPQTTEHEPVHEHHAHRHHEHRQHAPGHIANPSSKRRESHAESVRKLPGKLLVKAGDLAVRLIDAGDNRMGIGIKVEVPEGRALSEDEKQIIRQHVKGEEGEQTGFHWDRDSQMWHKPIVRHGEDPAEVPRTRPVAIRLDAESRVEKLADALRQHQADPVGFAESVKQRREQAAESGRIPD